MRGAPRLGSWYSILFAFAMAALVSALAVLLDNLHVANVYDTLSVVALALMVVAIWNAWVMRQAASARPSPVASERADVAVRDAVVVVLVGALAVRRLTGWPVPPELITAGLLLVLFSAGIYAVRLLVWYYRGEFEG